MLLIEDIRYTARRLFYFLGIFLLFACRQSGSSNLPGEPQDAPPEFVADIDLDAIRKRGYLTAIMDNSSTGLFIYKGKTMGYEYELLQLFTRSQGLDLRINITASLEEGFRKLNSGEGDVIAYNLTVTKERKKRIAFSHYHNLVRQVLVQRKPQNWRSMKLHEIEAELIRNPIELIGKEVYVRNHSAYAERLQNLSDEIGGDIIIIEEEPEIETETLIKKVAEGDLDFTVAEEDIALVNATYYPNLDVGTAVSFPTQIAWGVRKNADQLLDQINKWILTMRKDTDYYVIYDKYFKSRKASLKRSLSDYYSLGSGKISPFDYLIKESASKLDWDWRLMAAQIYKESKFDPNAESWAGAVGLMQLLPLTAEEYGVEDLKDPGKNIFAGTQHLIWLNNVFDEVIPDTEERLKFVLAAYNVGHGHVMDAIRLTEKYGGDPEIWDEVVEYLLKKSKPAYYNDPVVKYGYCRGIEPVDYVRTILAVYENYMAMFPEEPLANESI